jgi:hypothetical protein
VCCYGDVPAAHALDLLSSLIDKSLVIKEDGGGVACYRLHETMREYARLRLREAGEEEATEQRCADYYLSRSGDFRESEERLTEGLLIARQLDDRVAQCHLIGALGCCAARAREPRLAAQLFGAMENLRAEAGGTHNAVWPRHSV